MNVILKREKIHVGKSWSVQYGKYSKDGKTFIIISPSVSDTVVAEVVEMALEDVENLSKVT